ncbi:hypothetical protein BKA80DRAFT_42256 [Phyllosticta citrichinensis]
MREETGGARFGWFVLGTPSPIGSGAQRRNNLTTKPDQTTPNQFSRCSAVAILPCMTAPLMPTITAAQPASTRITVAEHHHHHHHQRSPSPRLAMFQKTALRCFKYSHHVRCFRQRLSISIRICDSIASPVHPCRPTLAKLWPKAAKPKSELVLREWWCWWCWCLSICLRCACMQACVRGTTATSSTPSPASERAAGF